MSKHTPGPWKAYCRDVNYKDGEAWPKEKFLQWEVSGPDVPDGRGEYYEADARLIAAAPDLLEALRGAVVLFACQCHKDCTTMNWLDRAEAALSKAGGELFNTGVER